MEKLFKIAVNFIWVTIFLFTLLILLHQNVSVWKITFILVSAGFISRLIINGSIKKFHENQMPETLYTYEKNEFLNKFFEKKGFNLIKFLFIVVLQYFIAFFYIGFVLAMLKSVEVDLIPQVIIVFISLSIFPVVIATWVELQKSELLFMNKIFINTVTPMLILSTYFHLRQFPFSMKTITPIITILVTNLAIYLVKIDYGKTKIKERLFLLSLPIIPYSILFAVIIVFSIFMKLI